MSTIDDIQLFHIKNGLKEYTKINLIFSRAILDFLNNSKSKMSNSPFTTNLFLPTESITISGVSYSINSPIANTNLYYFIDLMITETNSFISTNIETLQTIFDLNRKTIQSFTFFSSYITLQERFYKNLINYFNLYSFFTTMTYLPIFQNSTEIISSELQTLLSNNKIVLLQSSSLYNTNLRNMNSFNKNIFINQIGILYNQLQTCSIIIQKIYSKFDNNSSLLTTIISKFQTFSEFFTTIFEKWVFYEKELIDWDRNVFNLENVDYTQQRIEGSLNNILSHMSSSNFINTLSIDNGGNNNIIGDILTLSTNSSSNNGTAIVTSTLDGVIESVGTITNGGEGFQVGDSLTLSQTTGLYADLEVSTITSGFVDGVSIQTTNRGSGFIVGDTTTTSSLNGTGMTISINSVRTDVTSQSTSPHPTSSPSTPTPTSSQPMNSTNTSTY